MPTIRPITPVEMTRDAFGAFSGCKYRVLAQGDSWFSLGSLNPFNSNLLFEIETTAQIGAVNCAYPGRTLAYLVDTVKDSAWLRLLNDTSDDWHWDALFYSAGGNDLIGALQATAVDSKQPTNRLLLTKTEWDMTLPPATRYISEPGWRAFTDHMTYWFNRLVELRDSPKSAARGAPLFIHTYNQPTPRNAPAVASLAGPWLFPALRAYEIPSDDWDALADELIARLSAFLRGFATLPNVFVFDSSAVPLARARQQEQGADGDWQNEIHPSHSGYRKLGRLWGAEISAILT